MTAKQLMKKMMAFRPVSGDIRAVNRIVDFLARYLKDKHIFTKTEKLNGRKILYASTVKGKSSKVLLNAHLDVVPADESVFRYREKGNWIMGRGAGDCLGNCAVIARVLAAMVGKADIGAVFSTDEETGGETTAYMVDRGYKGDFVIILDGGGYRIATAQKGVVTIALRAVGKACHGSTPWRGMNAIDRLIEGYLEVKKLFPPVREGNEWHTTMSANIIHSGTVFNRVPDEAEMILDIRHTEETSPRKLMKKIRSTSQLKVSAVRKQPMVFCNEKDPRLLELSGFMKKHLRRKIRIVRMNGATDARHFTRLRVPIAMIGIPASGAHSSKERASIPGMKLYEKMLRAYCLTYT